MSAIIFPDPSASPWTNPQISYNQPLRYANRTLYGSLFLTNTATYAYKYSNDEGATWTNTGLPNDPQIGVVTMCGGLSGSTPYNLLYERNNVWRSTGDYNNPTVSKLTTTTGGNSNKRDMAFGTGIFAAVSSNFGDDIEYSSDFGLTWNTAPAPAGTNAALYTIDWSEELKCWHAFGNSGEIFYSD